MPGNDSKAEKVTAVIVVIIVLCLALALKYGPLEGRSGDFAPFAKVIGTLILVSAIMERVLDVFLTFLHGEGADETSDALGAAQKELDDAKAAVDANPNDANAKTALTTAQNGLVTAQNARRVQRTKTRQSALPAAIVLGVLISAIGFRALDSLVVVPKAGDQDDWWTQPYVFHGLDIILTGAVLAGGSDGLHKLMEVYRSVTEKKK